MCIEILPGGQPSPRFFIWVAVLLTACGGGDDAADDGGVPAPDSGVVADAGEEPMGPCDPCPDDGSPRAGACPCEAEGARMRLDPEADDFYAVPFPHALRVTDAGTPELSGWPFADKSAFLHNNLAVLADNTPGFGTTSAILLSFDAPLAPKTVEVDAAESLTDAAPVVLVNVDADSDGLGDRIPITCAYRERATEYYPPHFLSCLPVPGFAMRPNTLYALALTDRIESKDGTPLGRPALFSAIAEGDDDVDRALADSYAPLLEFAAANADDLSEVVGGTVFRTQDPIAPMRALSRYVEDMDAPLLLGSFTRLNVVPNNPDEASGFSVLRGRYTAPIFQTGETPYNREGGEIRFDEEGEPIVASELDVRVVVSLPDGEPPADGYPVALYHHGTGGDATSFVRAGHAHHLAAAGVAVVGIDAPVHGERNPTGMDPTLLFFNIQNMLALRDNIRQGAADLMVLKRFVLAVDVPADASPTGAAIRFDPERLFYFGHSQGGLTGPLMLAVTGGFKGAMLSGAGGSVVTSIVHKKTPFDLLQVARTLTRVADDEVLDAYHPVLSIVQAFTESADTSNFAPYFFRFEGGHGLDVWATEGMQDDQVPPPITDAFVTAAGLAPMRPVVDMPLGTELLGIESFPAPVRENVMGADGQVYTGVFSQYAEGDHFVTSQLPGVEAQLTAWFASLVQGRGELIEAP